MSRLPVRLAALGAVLLAAGGAAAQQPATPAGRAANPCIVTDEAFALSAATERKSYLPPHVDTRQKHLWGAAAAAPDGTALAFGGRPSEGDDPRGHTCLKIGGAWVNLHADLMARNPLQPFHARIWALRDTEKNAAATVRYVLLQGLGAEEQVKALASAVAPIHGRVAAGVLAIADALRSAAPRLDPYDRDQATRAAGSLIAIAARAHAQLAPSRGPASPELLEAMGGIQIALEKTAEMVDAEPPPRTFSPLAFDPKTGLFILFGGDHFDYLTGDTWVFDPKLRLWMQRHPAEAPAPRANHALTANGDGTVTLQGGYTYRSGTGYQSPQYGALPAGTFVYDVAANAWQAKGGDALAAADARTYRSGPFLPGYFLQTPAPDRAATVARLGSLPPNSWVKLSPPHRPPLNRDWGTVALDPERDVLLRWSGGHGVHSGTDVVHYHLATNRWELPFPIELPLGETYYKYGGSMGGLSFNRRPWMPMHSYQAYAYDRHVRHMVFTGGASFFLYDATTAEWGGRYPSAAGMTYYAATETLTLQDTPHGLMCWTARGQIFRFDPDKMQWVGISYSGKLPGSVVDNSSMTYDSKRNRLLMVSMPYPGQNTPPFDRQVFALDLKTSAASALNPGGMGGDGGFVSTDRFVYHPDLDIAFLGRRFKDGANAGRWPAYDAASNRWVTLRIGGDAPDPGPSLGLAYDARRKLVWALDAVGEVWALRLDRATADMRPL